MGQREFQLHCHGLPQHLQDSTLDSAKTYNDECLSKIHHELVQRQRTDTGYRISFANKKLVPPAEKTRNSSTDFKF